MDKRVDKRVYLIVRKYCKFTSRLSGYEYYA